jgi:hypothetical protein
MKIYIVTAYRWGDRECHSYIVGAFLDKKIAIDAAEKEEEYRGGNKYKCQVIGMEHMNTWHPVRPYTIYYGEGI